jgi:predicted ribonuclease YlaK
MYFYDTCALINDQEVAFNEHFIITDLTLYELEDIKTSRAKDDEIKARARKLLHLLNENEDKYTIVPAIALKDKNNDERIVATASYVEPKIPFRTDDLACAFIAKCYGLEVVTQLPQDDEYTGFKKLVFKTEDDTVDFYGSMLEGNKYDLETNEYLLIYVNDRLIDKQKWNGEYFEPVGFPSFESKYLGKVKPKDEYQAIALDSLKNNQMTLLRGAAGTGKSYLAMGYLLDRLEKGVIDKIIIFCNTVATAGSAKLGYYPGSRDEKLLDAQIGNFLASKLGGMDAVHAMMSQERLILLPFSDLRGYDTTGMHAGIYITEAQNLDIELMRLALQRIGDDSICILDGDDNAQVDMAMYAGARNGIKRVSQVFRGQPFYGEVTLQNIHRSKIAAIAQQM